MNIIKYLQLPFSFDAGRMLQEVNEITSGNWLPHYQKMHYEGGWNALPLRSVNGVASDIVVSPLPDSEYKDTVFLQQSPYLTEVLSYFKCPLLAVRLLKLDAGAVIKEHRDAELAFESGEARIHIPVVTDEAVEFYLDNERISPKLGECWYMNFNLPHRISNNSKINRIHLVIDATVNDWMTELFNGNSCFNKKEVDSNDFVDAATKAQIISSLRELNTTVARQLADDMESKLTVG